MLASIFFKYEGLVYIYQYFKLDFCHLSRYVTKKITGGFMSEESTFKIYTEARGQYVLIKGERLFQIMFPYNAQIEENIEAMKEILTALEAAQEKQKELKAEVKK